MHKKSHNTNEINDVESNGVSTQEAERRAKLEQDFEKFILATDEINMQRYNSKKKAEEYDKKIITSPETFLADIAGLKLPSHNAILATDLARRHEMIKVFAEEAQSAQDYNTLGILYYYNREYDKAKKSFNMAKELDKSYSEPVNNLAMVHAKQGYKNYANHILTKSIGKFLCKNDKHEIEILWQTFNVDDVCYKHNIYWLSDDKCYDDSRRKIGIPKDEIQEVGVIDGIHLCVDTNMFRQSFNDNEV